MQDLNLPPRLRLANLPTRVQPLPRLSRQLGLELSVKRDDETGADLSGNKVRKLEFLLAEAREQKTDVVLTCGGVQSNHCRATAIAARRLGMDSVLFLRGTDPGLPDGNLFLDRMVGAETRFITPEEYADRRALLAGAAAELEQIGRRPYVIPEGGSNALGSCGYVALLAELVRQAEEAGEPGFPWDHIVCATGSGGTLAGLVLGARLLGLADVRIWGVPVCDDGAYFQDRVMEIAEEFAVRFGSVSGRTDESRSVPSISRAEIGVLDGYKGPAYAVPFAEELELILEVASEEGLFLDPVYTGKAFYGLIQEARSGRFGGERVLFLHTGGIFSLFAFRDVLFPV